MRDAYHEELDSLSDRLVQMATLVRSAMSHAAKALLDADVHLAEQVITGDDEVNKLETEVEEVVMDLMARQQPVASDLRTIISSLRMSGDLERMGDLAVHLAKTARLRYPESAVPGELHDTIAEMAKIADGLVAKAATVIATEDVSMGLELDADDDAMDHIHRNLFQVLLSPDCEYGLETAVDVTLAGRYFERFADHAVHLAENVVYQVTGQQPEEITDDMAP